VSAGVGMNQGVDDHKDQQAEQDGDDLKEAP
jgi:hypothetical protein